MRVVKAMGKAMFTMAFVGLIAMFVAAIVQASKVNPMVALAIILLIGLFTAITIWFYFTDNKK